MKNPFVRHRESRWLPLVDWAVVLFGIFAFTIAVLPNVVGAGAYFDEGYSAFLAKLDLLSMAGYTALDVHPPLYYALLHVWQWVVGDSVTALRLLSVVLGWAAIVFAFLIMRRGFGRQAAWLAVVLMALSPLFIRYGASMRMYTMALAIGLAASYVLMIALTSKRKWPWVVYAILVAAGMWTNYFMALIWVSHLAWLLYEHRRTKSIMKSWHWSIIGAFVLYLPWLPVLLFRYGEVQVSGFWIKPLSIDTLVSTVTMSLVFRNATSTTAWLAFGVIVLIAALIITGRRVYKKLDKSQQPIFHLIAAMSSLPIILLALASLPPLRSSYVFRYVLFASVASSLLIAIVVSYARFRKHDEFKRAALYTLTIVIFLSGAVHATVVGNRNLDTDSQNKLGNVIQDVGQYSSNVPIVIRSPYSYYAAALYETKDTPVLFIYSESLAKIGSSKPLYDHHENGISNFDGLDKVWIAGEDRWSVAPPKTGKWDKRDSYTEYDDITKKPAAFAVYYERAK